MASKGLGTGLEALFGDAALDLEEESRDFEYVPISRVEPCPNQPRDVFDENSLYELSESIREHGIISPLTVRELESGIYQIIAGERRWRAAKLAGLDELPVRIIEADDRKAAELALVENLQREDLNPIEEANGYSRLIKEFGLTQEETAKMVSRSRPAIANALRLLTLPEAVLEMIAEGTLSAGAAKVLVSIDNDSEKVSIANKIAKEGLSVREAEKLVRDRNRPERIRKENIYCRDIEKALGTVWGRKIKITGDGKKGKIELSYYDSEDFETLCKSLEKLKK